MSALDTSGLHKSAAFRLVADLDLYEDAMRIAAEEWPEMERFREASSLVEAMRMQAACLPQITVVWMHFLISHTSTLQGFARVRSLGERLDTLEQHIAALLDVQRQCLEIVSGQRRHADE